MGRRMNESNRKDYYLLILLASLVYAVLVLGWIIKDAQFINFHFEQVIKPAEYKL